MDWTELLVNRRSVRRYEDKSLPLDMVYEMIRESTLAPNAGNSQPWSFVVVNDKAMIQAISEESKKNILARINADPSDFAGKYRAMLENETFNVFYDAPCLVMILGPADMKNLWIDCSLAACYFMLAAASRGLGTCWVNLGAAIYHPSILDKLGITGDLQIVAPITVGFPESVPAAPKRKEPKILKVVQSELQTLTPGRAKRGFEQNKST